MFKILKCIQQTVLSPCTVAVVGLLSVGRLIFQVPVSLWIAECFFHTLYFASSFSICMRFPAEQYYPSKIRPAHATEVLAMLYKSSCTRPLIDLPATLSWNVLSSWRHVSMEKHSCNFMCIIACWCNQIKLIMHSITVLIFILQATLFYVKPIIAPYCTQRVNAFICNALFLTMFNILN